MNGTKSNHRIFVLKKDLTSTGLYPTSSELYDLMHIVSCVEAAKRWEEEWSYCPVCLAGYEEDGRILHRHRKDITQ